MAAFSSLMGPTTAAAAAAAATGKVFVGMSDRRSRNSSSSVAMAPSRFTIQAVTTASRLPICPSIISNLSSLIQSGSKEVIVFDYKNMMVEEDEVKKNKRNESVTAEKLDEWIRESIGEIVKNIGEAPFLVQIFSQGPSSVRLEKEKASLESWPLVKKRWDQGICKPDGVILVEELNDDEEEEEDDAPNSNNDNDSSHKTWGLVVQGRGADCAASCYILNTCRVKSAGGFCTHFCLVRAKCFGETWDKQLKKAWLQGR